MTDTANAPRNMIFNGDCIDVMQAFDTDSIDFILTDPPYVTHYRDRQGRSVPNDDNGRWLKPAFAEKGPKLRQEISEDIGESRHGQDQNRPGAPHA